MKYIFGLIACLLSLSVLGQLEDIYVIPLDNMEGNRIDLNQYRGKKLMFIILPASSADTSVSYSDISAFQASNKESLVVIGIPALDVGDPTPGADRLKELYREKTDIIVAECLNVKKGTGQASLFGWLTRKDRNRHFDQDVELTGSKFFVDEKGELYAVLGPRFNLSSPMMSRVLTRKPK